MNDTLEMIQAVARQAGAVLMDGFGRVTHVEHKGATDLVTEYDRRSEDLIVAALRARFPEHAILAEESGATGDGSLSGGYRWVVDPLDGTTNFAHGFGFFAVSIALTLDNRPVIGVVYDPLRDELWSAEAGRGATLNGGRIHVSSQANLREALLATGFTYDLANAPRNNFKEFAEFALKAQGIRRAGAAALDLHTQLVVSLGAGIYEELLFRVVVVGALMWGSRRLLRAGRGLAAGIAVVVSALVFSAFHYVGAFGDTFTVASFTYRAIAGVAFSVLYVTRGFGITAWTHALYDLGLSLLQSS